VGGVAAIRPRRIAGRRQITATVTAAAAAAGARLFLDARKQHSVGVDHSAVGTLLGGHRRSADGDFAPYRLRTRRLMPGGRVVLLLGTDSRDTAVAAYRSRHHVVEREAQR
jgi:hypothetical protein